jgi:hypothetical protein
VLDGAGHDFGDPIACVFHTSSLRVGSKREGSTDGPERLWTVLDPRRH